MNAVRQRPLAIGPLRAFEAVARRLSFRAAGEELHLTQPAISRQINALETELGATLFHRGTRKVELTAAGSQPVKDELRANTEDAIARGVFGAPTFFIGKQMFWGNDRLPLMSAFLKGELA